MAIQKKRLALSAAAILAAALGASEASADSVLQFDVNGLTATAVPTGGGALPFSTSFTGTVTLEDDGNSSLAGIFIDSTDQGYAGTLSDFTGSIFISSGAVTGGSFTITDTGGDFYTASILGGGSVGTAVGQSGPFTIDGLTFAGDFSDAMFANVDISIFEAEEPVSGSFLEFTFGPDGTTGIDSDADIDVFVVVPSPSAALAAIPMLGILGLRRRRQQG